MKSAFPDPRIAYFDGLADGWDQQGPSGEEMTAGLASHAGLLALRAGQSLLEVGCGTGKTTQWLARAVSPGPVTAVDFSPEMIERARAKGIEADFACRDVCADDLGREVYDVILCFHSFPHFRDQPAALGHLSAALRPGGRLIVMHLAGSEQINGFHASLDGPVSVDHLPAGDQWPPLLSPAGLDLTRLEDREDLFFMEACRR
jgi:demethylmenaquinone methyltransferase/2-methoxy-6-polyprenyl-1,4-benzoquinol methylase